MNATKKIFAAGLAAAFLGFAVLAAAGAVTAADMSAVDKRQGPM